jgi:hypothetical protein
VHLAPGDRSPRNYEVGKAKVKSDGNISCAHVGNRIPSSSVHSLTTVLAEMFCLRKEQGFVFSPYRLIQFLG